MINISNIFSKKNKVLVKELIRTDFKLRYQGSVLGYLWSFFKPLMLFLILYIVFTKFITLGKGTPNYAVSLLLGIVLWTFFIEATSNSLKSIVGRGSLIRKIKIPIYLIPVSTVASAFINLCLNLIVVFIFVIFSPIDAFSWKTAVFLPLVILELTLLSTAVGLFLSATYVRFRDIDHIWDVVRQALFYTIPIIYPLTRIPSEVIQKIIMVNPLAQIIQDARFLVTYEGTIRTSSLYESPLFSFAAEIVPLLLVATALLVGVWYFKKEAKYFSENV